VAPTPSNSCLNRPRDVTKWVVMVASGLMAAVTALSLVVSVYWVGDVGGGLHRGMGLELNRGQLRLGRTPNWYVHGFELSWATSPWMWGFAPEQGSATWGIALPLWIPLFVLSVPAYCMWRPIDRGRSLCPRCSYDLTGNTTGVCPECGAAVQCAPSEPRNARP
jgi:hypothetical protein